MSSESSGDRAAPPRTGVSGMAIAALGTSLAPCCPLMPLIGALLGLRALVAIKANPSLGGRGIALAATWIGSAAFMGWIVLLFWWNGHVRSFLLEGPQTAIRSGYTGDLAAFRGQFTGDGAAASDDRIRAFIEPLRSRWGAFDSAVQDDAAPAPMQSGGRDVVIPYVLRFDRGEAKAQVRILLFADLLVPRLLSISVSDPERGDITFP